MSNTDTAINADGDAVTTINSKSVFESRRGWGALMLIVPLVLQLGGFTLTTDQNAQVVAAIQHAQSGFQDLMIVLGAAQMLFGSWKARQPLHIAAPYAVEAETGKKVPAVKPLVLTSDVARIMDEKPVHGDPAAAATKGL